MSNRGGGSRSRGGGSWDDDADVRNRPASRRDVGSRSRSGGLRDEDFDEYEDLRPRNAQPKPGRDSSRAGKQRWNSWDDTDDDVSERTRRKQWDAPAPHRGQSHANWERQDDPRYGDPRASSAGLARRDLRDARPDRDAFGLGQAARPGGRVATAERSERDTKKPGVPRGALIILALVALVAVGGGAAYFFSQSAKAARPTTLIADAPFATYTPGASPTAIANFKDFSSTRSKYTVQYPGAWTVASHENTIDQLPDYSDVFSLPSSPSHVSIEYAGTFSTVTEQNMIKGEVTGAQQGGTTFAEVQTTTPTQVIGGAQWQRHEYNVTVNGQPLHMVIMATHHGGRGYVIVLVSSAAEFGNDSQAIFEPMLASFRFAN